MLDIKLTSDLLHTNEDSRELSTIKLVMQLKWLLLFFPVIFTILSMLYALSLPNIYRSDALLAPSTEKKSGIGALAGQLGGLASMAGLSLGGSGIDNTDLAIEVLRSRDFIATFIQKYDLKRDIMAVSMWDPVSKKLSYDKSIIDTTKNLWVRDVQLPMLPEPSLLETVIKFQSGLSVSKDKLTSLVTISVEHISPIIAQQWLSWLIRDVNEAIRQRDIDEAKRSISYLKDQANSAEILEIKSVIYQLVEEQTKTLMLAQVRKEYALSMIETPVVAEVKSKPMRAVLVISAALLGFMLSIFILIVRKSSIRATASQQVKI